MHFKPQTLQSLKIPNAFPAIDPPELILLLISNQYTANEISTIHSKIYSTIKPQQLIGAVVDNIAKKGFLIHSLKGIGFYSSGGVEHRHKQVGRWHSSSPQHKPNKQIFNTISQSTNAINKNIIPNLDKNLQVGSFITLSDTEPLDLYRYLNLKYPNATKLGLITSKTPFINGKHHTIFYNDIIYESGTVGIAFENSSMMEIKYEGVEAIGGVFEITKCRGNIILEIRGENASKMLVKQVQESTLKSHFKDSADLFVKVIKDGGFNVDNTPKQGEAVFKVTGGDITKGTLAIDTKSDLCVGMKVQFMRQIGSGNMTRTDASGVFRFGVKEKEDYVKKVIHQEHVSENQWIEGMDVDVKSEEGVVVYSNGVLDGFQLMNVPGISVEMGGDSSSPNATYRTTFTFPFNQVLTNGRNVCILLTRKLPTVLITGASGLIGIELIKMLPKDQFKIVAGVLPEEPTTQELNTYCDKVVELDYDLSSSVQEAFEQQIDYLFLIPSKSEERALQAKRLVAVAIEQNIKFIVLVSLLDCSSRSGALAAQFRYMETHIESTGVPYTILRAAPLQQSFLLLKDDFKGPIADVSIPVGIGAYSPIHCKDISNVAKIILSDPTPHYGMTYRLTGPEQLTGVQIAGKASRGLNKPVRFSNRVSKHLTGDSSSLDRFLDLELYALISKGFFKTLSNDVEKLTGFKGISIQNFFMENQQEFGNVNQKFAKL